jgi:hypothetical protein
MWTDADLDRFRKEGNIGVEDFEVGVDIAAPGEDKTAFVVLDSVRSLGSGVEYEFAANYLEGRVESGEGLGWAFEPISIRMIGQTYTPDFVEWGADGVTRFYEVKGAKKIPSQDRSSAKYRTTAALFESDLVQFFWAKQKKDGSFKPRKLPKQGKRDPHPLIRKKLDEGS